MKKTTYKEVFQANQVFGKIKSKVLNSSSYISLLKLKNKTKKAVDDLIELEKQIQLDYKVEPNANGYIEFEPTEAKKSENFNKSIKELQNGEVSIDVSGFLSMKEFELLRKSNDLTLSEEELLFNWLVDESIEVETEDD